MRRLDSRSACRRGDCWPRRAARCLRPSCTPPGRAASRRTSRAAAQVVERSAGRGQHVAAVVAENVLRQLVVAAGGRDELPHAGRARDRHRLRVECALDERQQRELASACRAARLLRRCGTGTALHARSCAPRSRAATRSSARAGEPARLSRSSIAKPRRMRAHRSARALASLGSITTSGRSGSTGGAAAAPSSGDGGTTTTSVGAVGTEAAGATGAGTASTCGQSGPRRCGQRAAASHNRRAAPPATRLRRRGETRRVE